MANGVWKGVHLHVFGRSRQLSINMFFYKNTFFEKSIQLIGNLGKKKEKNGGGRKKIMLEIVGTNLVASGPPEHCLFQQKNYFAYHRNSLIDHHTHRCTMLASGAFFGQNKPQQQQH